MRKFLTMLLLLALCCCIDTAAQSIERQGNTFVSKAKSKGADVKTVYTYKDSQGKVYPVYLSSTTGKAYILKISKKTGKEYKQYVPEIGKQINPKAYKEK